MSFKTETSQSNPNTPLSLLHITREWAEDARYGLGKSLVPLNEALRASGFRVRSLTQEDLSHADLLFRQQWLNWARRLPGFRLHPHRVALLGAMIERMQVGLLAVKLSRQEGFSCLHAHDPWIGLFLWIGQIIPWRRKFRWGITEHGFGAYFKAVQMDGLVFGDRLEYLLRILECFILRRAQFVICPTKSAMVKLQQDLNLALLPTHWCSILHKSNKGLPMGREEARLKLGLSPKDRVIVAVGRLVPLKRFDRLLEACIKLNKAIPRLRIFFLGDGDQRNALEKILAPTGFRTQVDFVVTEEVGTYLAASDLYVSTSMSESFGLANLEALMHGVSCLCTPVGGVPEVMGDAPEYLSISLEDLEDKILTLMSDPARLEAARERSLHRAGELSTLNEMVKSYVAIYSGIEN